MLDLRCGTAGAQGRQDSTEESAPQSIGPSLRKDATRVGAFVSTPPPLASLHVGVLDRHQVSALRRDLQAKATVSSVHPKSGPRGASLGLQEGISLLLGGQMSGIEIRYRFENQSWCDTLMAHGPESFRLVRLVEG